MCTKNLSNLPYLVSSQSLQVVQDLSYEGLTQLVDLCDELGVSAVQSLIGVNWKRREELEYRHLHLQQCPRSTVFNHPFVIRAHLKILSVHGPPI